MAVVGGDITTNNTGIADLADNTNAGAYYVTNFNSMPNGLYTCLMIIINASLNGIQNTFTEVMGTAAGAWFVQIFFVFGSLVVFNVVISIFLDDYVDAEDAIPTPSALQLVLRSSHVPCRIEGDDDMEDGVKPSHVVPV